MFSKIFLKRIKDLQLLSLSKGIVLFLTCFACNTLIIKVLNYFLTPVPAAIIASVVVGPLIEENAKQIAIKGDFAQEFLVVFNAGEFGHYAINMKKAGFNLKGILMGRLPAVGLHITTMAIQKLADNPKIHKALGIDKEEDAEKRKRLSFIGHLIGLLVHATFNALSVKFEGKILEKIGNAGGHNAMSGSDLKQYTDSTWEIAKKTPSGRIIKQQQKQIANNLNRESNNLDL